MMKASKAVQTVPATASDRGLQSAGFTKAAGLYVAESDAVGMSGLYGERIFSMSPPAHPGCNISFHKTISAAAFMCDDAGPILPKRSCLKTLFRKDLSEGSPPEDLYLSRKTRLRSYCLSNSSAV